MTYLEAGSGAIYPVKSEIISMVKKAVNHPVLGIGAMLILKIALSTLRLLAALQRWKQQTLKRGKILNH